MGGQRKSGGGRVTPKGGASRGRLTGDEKAGLDGIFSKILRSVSDELADDLDPLEAELWASQMWSIWQRAELIGMDATAVFAGGLIDYATKRASPGRSRSCGRWQRWLQNPTAAGRDEVQRPYPSRD
jgi:hypothetical protein